VPKTIAILIPFNLKSGPISLLNIKAEFNFCKAQAILNSSVAVITASRILLLVVVWLSGDLIDYVMREHSCTLNRFIRCSLPPINSAQ
jgi:hypothetical protein